MKKIIINNLIILGSFLFFLVMSAFTFVPKQQALMTGCKTCPTQNTCADAQYCGMESCNPVGEWCTLSGALCSPTGEEGCC